ncbi:MAG: hypothetical protein CMM56_06805 [Rhodospirillaceae bacterium]|nr:hypothetical protein [Rhodospirillaceae bacterium]
MTRYQLKICSFIKLLLFLFSANTVFAQAVDGVVSQRQFEINARADQALQELFDTNSNAVELFENAAGYAAFSATKGGFFVTVGGGTGVLVDKASDSRTYMRMGTGGIGIGAGIQTFNLVIIFENQFILDAFKSGGWDSSATAQAAAGQAGISVGSSFVDGIAIYQLTDKGLMAVADVASTRFWVADNLN